MEISSLKRLFYSAKSKLTYDLEKKRQFPDLLSVVCIAKNEGPYIKEWVEYYLLQGVDRLYIYDNDSPDNMKEMLEPYIKRGEVVYTFLPGRARQLDAYNDAIRRFKNRTRYMAFLDCDEFLVQENAAMTLSETVDGLFQIRKDCGGIAVNWRMYGSSGLKEKPDGLVIENYLYRGNRLAKGNDCIKTVANPRRIKKYNHVHYPTYRRGYLNLNEEGNPVPEWKDSDRETKVIRINHYFTKSKEEWIERRSRGKADSFDDIGRSMDEFYEHDHNEIYDPIMLPYVAIIKERMNCN